MSRTYNVGLVGVGAVGAEMIRVLKARNFPCGKVQVFASRERDEVIGGETYHVRKAEADGFAGLDIVLFAGKTDVAIQLKDAVVAAGAKMIDNSRAFRQDPDVPLVVPQVNAEDLDWNKGVIANPNCTTAIMLEAVAPLHRAKKLKRLVASTYQAASGAGAAGMAELEEQMREMVAGKPLTVKAFAHQLTNNLIPHIDKFDETNWYTLEELKMRNEARKMLHAPDLMLSCTSVRVPIPRAHSESLNLEFEEEITPEEAREILSAAEGVKVVDDPLNNVYPMPLDATDKYDVLAGRIRQDISRSDRRGLEMFVSGDQLLRGAALNAVEIAEQLIARGLV
ncbi:MAG: aspartate-semialdehyde dehydrogenase [Kiritimatiellae bacterium]|nr:aspartate-semialdehyde dehydrogenase [Kiritimatiellia bacterium]